MRAAILKNEFDDNHEYWIKSCKNSGLDFEVIDILSSNWLDCLRKNEFDVYLTCPPGREMFYKEMYDEKVFILEKFSGKLLYPGFNEISIHENKKYLSYWLKANNLPHPETKVFYHFQEAMDFAFSCELPTVGKMNIGASGKGVKILKDRESLKRYIKDAFGDGVRQEWGPNLKMGSYGKRIISILKSPSLIKKKVAIYKKNYNEVQKNYVIIQKFVPHDFEWRIVRIGESYFGHQKIKSGEKASGSKGINYTQPPSQLLNFVKEICEKYNFRTMAIDLFEDGKGGYLINEMQCIFGHVQEYICEKDGQPGRFIENGSEWIFEPGLFNRNLSYDLRIKDVIWLLMNSNKCNHLIK